MKSIFLKDGHLYIQIVFFLDFEDLSTTRNFMQVIYSHATSRFFSTPYRQIYRFLGWRSSSSCHNYWSTTTRALNNLPHHLPIYIYIYKMATVRYGYVYSLLWKIKIKIISIYLLKRNRWKTGIYLKWFSIIFNYRITT